MRATRTLLLFAIQTTLLACIDSADPEYVEPELADDGDAEPVPVPTGLVQKADAIPSSYIVVLKSRRDARDHAATVERLMAGRQSRVRAHYTHALDGFAATLDEHEALELAADPEVAYVEEDARIHATATSQDNATWGIDRIDQPALPLDASYTYLDSGAGVTAYIFDTGIRATHGEFTGRILSGYGAIEDGEGTNDCNQHGTHVSGTVGGTVLGVAKQVSLVPVRVLDCSGSGSVSATIAAIDWVIANKRPLSVANMSLGGPPSDAEDAAVRRLIAAGVPVIVSAGNDAVDACTQSPARVAEAITVGATDTADARATFSNHGSCVDLFAPGVDIRAASVAGDTLARTLSGTSMAAPHVTGAVAMYLAAHPTATPAEVTAALLEGATRDKVADPQGSPNRLLSTRFVDSTPPSIEITAPAPDAEVPARFTVKADITDPNLSRVTVMLDGVEVASRTEGPFALEVSAQPGMHTIEVTAVDAAARTSTRTLAVTVTSDAPDPTGGDIIGGCTAGGGQASVLLIGVLAVLLRRRRSHVAHMH